MSLVIVDLVKNLSNAMVKPNKPYYLGLMAGTSLDGVDACIIDNTNKPISSHYLQYPKHIVRQIKSLMNSNISLNSIVELDIELAQLFAKTANELIANSALKHQDISAIGSHGQTIYHLPKIYSWQLANPAIIAEKTQIMLVTDFRMSDIAVGGQGAPLTPVYHKYLLQDKNGIIVNLGGIINITIVQNNKLLGFDIGPANTLMDNWSIRHQQKPYDKNGKWASNGVVITELLSKLLADNYFNKPAPKSTGTEYFNLNWLDRYLTGSETPVDVQATLLELTARSIANSLPTKLIVYLCGGGVHNTELVARINKLTSNKITTTNDLGISPDYVEAATFAFLAKQTLTKKHGNFSSVTGAKESRILGGVYNY